MLAHKSCCRNIKFIQATISWYQLVGNSTFFLACFAILGRLRLRHRRIAADGGTKESICGQIVYTIRRHLKDNTWLRGRKKISVTFGSTLAGALQRCPSLAVLALRRAGRLASHPAIAAQT
jgi:hypothetical protein